MNRSGIHPDLPTSRRALGGVSLLLVVAVALSSGLGARDLAVGPLAGQGAASVKQAAPEQRRTVSLQTRRQDHKPNAVVSISVGISRISSAFVGPVFMGVENRALRPADAVRIERLCLPPPAGA